MKLNFEKLPQIGDNVSNIFAWVGGVNLETFEKMPSPLKSKHTMFGFFLTAMILAQACIAGFAWGELLHSGFLGFFIGIAWIFVMGSVDRTIMIFVNNELAMKEKHSILPVIARWIIILFVSYLNSTMVEIIIFDPEIKKDLIEQKHLEKKLATKTLDSTLKNFDLKKQEIQKQTDLKRDEYLKWSQTQETIIYNQQIGLRERQTDLVKEIEGTGGSKSRGDAQVATAKRIAIAQDSAALSTLQASFDKEKALRPEFIALQKAEQIQVEEFKKNDEEIAKAKVDFDNKKSLIETMANDGFSHRFESLHRIGSRSILVWIVWGFFFFLESSILIIKLMMGRDTYHEVLKQTILKYEIDATHENALNIENSVSEYESKMNETILARTTKRKTEESQLNSEELALYPIIKKRILDQFAHASDVGLEIDKVSSVDFSIKNLFKFNFLKKLLRLQPNSENMS